MHFNVYFDFFYKKQNNLHRTAKHFAVITNNYVYLNKYSTKFIIIM